jgi:hypothetical protein
MSRPDDLERFLARLYTDPSLVAAARRSPREVALEAGLAPRDAQAVARLDWDDVALAAESFASKRDARARGAATRPGLLRRLWRRIRR